MRFTARLETARLDDRTNRDAREKHRRNTRDGDVGVRVRGHDTTHRQSCKHKQVGDDNDDDDDKSVNAILMRKRTDDDDDDDDL